MQETSVRALSREDPLEKGMATHSSILAWRIAWTRSLVGHTPGGHKEWDTTEWLTSSLSLGSPPYWLAVFYESLNPSEKAMAPYSSTLVWKIPWAKEPSKLQSMGLLRVRYDWVTSLSLFTFMHWGRKWQPTPVFLPGESQGWRSLVGCRLWGCTESDTTEVT